MLTSAALLVSQVPPPAIDPIVEPIIYYDSGEFRPPNANRENLEVIRRFSMRPDVTAIIIKAHTDTVGSTEANRALSQLRATAIAEILEGDGVDSSKITIEALGETQLARSTADGVDEPLNRRVWVDFRF